MAFANSVRPGHVATILIGEENDGKVPGVSDPDRRQRDIRDELEKIYPAIEWRQTLYEKGGKPCIRIEIEFSGETPHFGDAAWVRVGSETIKASEAMLQRLVDLRSSKTIEISKWVGRNVTGHWATDRVGFQPNWMALECKVIKVTGFYCTLERPGTMGRISEPLQWVDISWDDRRERLSLFFDPSKPRGL